MSSTHMPEILKIRLYQMGFGDCCLLSFHYPKRSRVRTRHLLIDCGTTAFPKREKKTSHYNIAKNIEQVCGERLHAIVVTHRHSDHLSGFEGRSGDVIKGLKPKLIIQPWTEDPKAKKDAKKPTRFTRRRQLYVHSLDNMHRVTELARRELEKHTSGISRSFRRWLGFQGEEGIKNKDAIDKLHEMSGRPNYVYYGKKSGLDQVIPGIKTYILGPPTLKQSDKIVQQRHEDEAEFWHLQALAGERGAGIRPHIFKNLESAHLGSIPFEARWFLPRLDDIRRDELLEIVRILDYYLNNTSVILLIELGTKKLLFPGDAQIENWNYALKAADDRDEIAALLAKTDLYKVGHHGSLNATPKTLWNMFERKGDKEKPNRLKTIMSTLEKKHGCKKRNTEVPREKLVDELKKNSDFFTTQKLTGEEFFKDFEITP